MKLTNTSFLAVLILSAVELSGAALTFDSQATCTAGNVTVTGSDSCLARDGFTFAGANSSAQPLNFGEVNLEVGVVMEGNGNHASISARAGFDDLFIVYGQPDGTPAFLEMTASVYSGTDTDLVDAIRLAGLSFTVQHGFGGQMTFVVPFNFGEVMDFSVQLELASAAEDCEDGCSALEFRSAGFALQEFRVLNTMGREATGYKFHTASETAYTFVGGQFQDPAAVPEPATFAVTGVALVVAGACRRRR